jgi:hypothetical protein
LGDRCTPGVHQPATRLAVVCDEADRVIDQRVKRTWKVVELIGIEPTTS